MKDIIAVRINSGGNAEFGNSPYDSTIEDARHFKWLHIPVFNAGKC